MVIYVKFYEFICGFEIRDLMFHVVKVIQKGVFCKLKSHLVQYI